jgi:hypothetical protein
MESAVRNRAVLVLLVIRCMTTQHFRSECQHSDSRIMLAACDNIVWNSKGMSAQRQQDNASSV